MNKITHNWAEHVAFGHEVTHFPASLTEVQDTVRAATKLRPIGSRHSFNAIADTAGGIISLRALERRIASLESTASAQATELAAARATLDARADIMSSAPEPATEVAEAEQPKSSATPAALTADGPTKDCIPLGTRFMSQTGDSFPICKTSVVVNVSSVSEGTAIVEGAGPVAAGGFANLPVQGCTVMVFTADAAGFAEMRVSCT